MCASHTAFAGPEDKPALCRSTGWPWRGFGEFKGIRIHVDVGSDPLQSMRPCLALSCSCTSQCFACVHLQLLSDIKMRDKQAVPVFSFSCLIIPIILAVAEDASVLVLWVHGQSNAENTNLVKRNETSSVAEQIGHCVTEIEKSCLI